MASERDPVQPGCMVREPEEHSSCGWRVLARRGDVAWLCRVVEDVEGTEHQVIPQRVRRAPDGLWCDDEECDDPTYPLRLVPADDEATRRVLDGAAALAAAEARHARIVETILEPVALLRCASLFRAPELGPCDCPTCSARAEVAAFEDTVGGGA